MPVNINKLLASQIRKSRWHDTRDHTLDAEIANARAKVEALEKKKNALKYPHFIDNVIWPIAKELGKRLDMDASVLGPFGLNTEVSIHLYPKDRDKSKRGLPEGTRSITFRPRWDEERDDETGKNFVKSFDLHVVDHRVNTHRYRDGTLGDLNGDNYNTVPMPKTINGLIKWIELQEKK